MSSKLTAYVTTGPARLPEDHWAKAIGLPHLTYGGGQVFAWVLLIIFIAFIVGGAYTVLTRG
jgi:hypothetical protein